MTVPYLGPPAHYTRGNNLPVHRIVIHCTVSPCKPGGARNVARYFKTEGAGGSAHYIVDPAEAVQGAHDEMICWHAPPNLHSLGVELCDPMTGGNSRWADDDHRDMLNIAARLVAQLCARHEVPIVRLDPDHLRAGRRGITGHVDVSQAFKQSTHYDPGPGFPWPYFIHAVQQHSNSRPPPEVDDVTKAELTKALNDDKDPLTIALKGVVRSVVQSELRQEREGENPGQAGAR